MCTVYFSDREKDIMKRVVEGDSNKMIAGFFNISEHTVRTHLRTLMIKTGLNNRTQLAVYVIRNNII